MIPYYLSAAKVFLRSGRANPGGHGDQAFSSGVTALKCHLMRHETAPTAGNAISCDTKWLRRPELPFHATRNDFDGRKYHFWWPEMAANLFLVVSGEKMRFRTSASSPQKMDCGLYFTSPVFKRTLTFAPDFSTRDIYDR